MPLMELYGKNAMPDVDNLLTSFYQLDDEARSEIIATIKMKPQYHKDVKRLPRKSSEADKRTFENASHFLGSGHSLNARKGNKIGTCK